MRVCVLFNPRAGSAGQIDALRAALAAEPGLTLTFRELGPDDDLAAVTADAARSADVVAVAGGDGSVHAAVNGLVSAKADAALAVLPLGTGNDFCRTMDIPLDPVAAAGLIRTGRPRTIDAVAVDGGGTGYFVNAATGGFSGRVASEVTPELKAFWGPLAYLRGAAGPVAELPQFRLTVRFDGGKPEHFDALNVVVANGRTAAGGMPVAPTANPEDGQLDVVIVRAGGVLDLSVIAARLMHGDYLGDENVTHRLARRVEVESDPPIPFSVDGELCEGARFAFEAVPRAVRVLAGPGYHAAPDPEPALEDGEPPETVKVAVTKGFWPRVFGLLGGILLLAKRAPKGYLAGLGLAAVAVLLFTWLANGVVGGRWAEWNATVQKRVWAAESPPVTGFAVAVTSLCNGREFALLVVAAVGVFLARRRYVDAAGLLGVVAGVVAMESVLKSLFAVARPVLPEPRFTAPGYAFPSGHALRAVGFFGYVAAVTVAGHWRVAWRWAVAAGCVFLAFAVCWSRVYLGVHWPTDVIAGGLAAGAWAAACLVARHYSLTRPRRVSTPPVAERVAAG